ncbi:MAG: ribonuclease Z [Marinilabiliaceae bacterium]|nr:ribonuclease Z [Marinilabiliaceae bacterium]
MTFSVTILGSNSALPTSERHPTAQVLNVSERFFLIDCGEGTQMQLRKYHIKFAKINHIFISHLHGDHLFGLIGLISTFGLLGRKTPLNVYAHPDLENLMLPHLSYFCADLPFEVRFIHTSNKERQIVFEDQKVIVETIPLKHRISTVGYIFTEKTGMPNIRKECILKYNLSIAEIASIKKGSDLKLSDGIIIPNSELIKPPKRPRSYAFCSDTKYFKSLANELKDVQLLYHESTFLDSDKELAKKTTHSTSKQAALIAKDAGAQRLIIGHFSSRYNNLSAFIDEAREIFENTDLAIEGAVFNIDHS